MNFNIKKANKKQTKIKLLISGPSGSGKTYSSLLLAYGMTGDWNKIVVIDSERGSADLYDHLGSYSTLTLEPPYAPEVYIEAIKHCVSKGFDIIIIDSITHEWDGVGGCLEIHGNMTGNSYINWNKVTPRHNAFINAIIQSPVHMICTSRAKQDYVLVDKNDKKVPEKLGLRAITREGFDFEVTLSLDLDIRHNATSTKDRTGLFLGKPDFIITSETGNLILNWCNSGENISSIFNIFSDKLKSVKDYETLDKIQDQIIANKSSLNEIELEILREQITDIFTRLDLSDSDNNYVSEDNNDKPLSERSQEEIDKATMAAAEEYDSENNDDITLGQELGLTGNPFDKSNNDNSDEKEKEVKDMLIDKFDAVEVPIPEKKEQPNNKAVYDNDIYMDYLNKINKTKSRKVLNAIKTEINKRKALLSKNHFVKLNTILDKIFSDSNLKP